MHLFLNSAWIKGVASNLFDRKLPKKTRITVAVDILLLISFFLIIVTGVLISKKLFGFGLKAPWIVIHFFCTALMIILMGIHIGLHWGYLKQHLPKLPKAVALVMTVVICAFGVYSMFTSSFGSWLSRPFVKFEGHGEPQNGAEWQSNEMGELGEDAAQGEVPQWTDAQRGKAEQGGATQSEAGMQEGARHGGHEQQPFSLTRLLALTGTYFSILFTIGKATNIVDTSVRKKKRPQPVQK